MDNLTKQQKHQAKLFKERKCYICGELNETNHGKRRCRNCTKTSVENNKMMAKEAYEKGLCIVCKKHPHKPNIKSCQICCDKRKEWYHKSNYKERYRKRDKKRRKNRKIAIFNHYGGKCICCGENRIEFLSIDHINNDGAEHRKKIFGSNKRSKTSSITFYKWIEKHNYPSNLQILCFNCNIAKHHNNGTCPHQSDN